MRKIFFTLSFLVLFSLSFSQDLIRAKQNVNFEQSDELQKLELSEACSGNSTENSENQSPFEAVKGKKEDLSKRDAFSKHYINEDGSYTALIGAGPIHYDNNGNWEDINHRIVETNDSDYKYANTTNVFESYFGTYLQNGIISKTQEAKLIEFLNPKMYWEVNGEATQIQTAENVQVSIEEDKAIYKNIFGEISAEYTILTAKRELNYIIPSLEALGNIVSQAEYLVFVEEIELAENLTATLQEQGIIIKDQYGESIYLYENPHSTDAETMALRVENTIFEMQQNGNILTIKTKVKTSWLLDVERVFPVRVDPTTSVYPDNTTNWTVGLGSDGYSYGATGVVGHDGYAWVQTYMKFNSSAIPTGSTVVGATGYIYLTHAYTAWNGPWQWANSADPTTTSGTTLYNSANLGYSNIVNMTSGTETWKNSSFYNPEGYTYIQEQLSNGVILASVVTAGSYYSEQYYKFYGYNNTNRPYLSITYTESNPLNCSPLSNLAVQLGNPFNGTNHYIDISWDALQAATGYDIQYSDDNSNWQDASPSSVTTTSASLNMGDNPNKKYWFRVRAKNNTITCEWNSIGPIYTACDEPELPYLSNAVGTSLDLEIQAETPVANPNITEYAIYCETTSQYVQANGYLGASSAWQTKANWGTVNVKGLTANEEYCFYVLARNGDGHIVGEQEGGGNIIISETFDTNSNFSNSSSSGPTDKWWSPGTTTSGNTMSHSSSGSECGTNGFVGYGGNWNNYHGSFLRSPEINCNGFDAITMTFDFTNTGTNRENDYLSFNMWADGGYVNALSVNGNAGNKLQFDIARTCENIKVEFDISGIANKSNIMFYINANCGYNDSPMYSYQIKNVILAESVSSSENSACITLGLASTPIFHDFGGEEQLSFNYSKYNNDKPIFRLSHPGSSATKYEIEVNTKFDFTGSSWTQTYTGTYSENTENNFAFTQTSGNLTSGSTYYVRARIDQGSGWGMWTNELYSFTYDTNITIPEWFKTTTPQFSTDALVGTINQSDELKPEVSGGGGNIIVNGNFANTSGWTTYKTSGTGAVIEVSSSDCVNCPPGTTRNLKISLYVASVVGGDKLIVSQQVDLTGVDQITYNANSYYAPNSNGFSGKISDLKFIIGGSYNDESGTVMHSTDQAYCSGSYCSNTLNDNNVVINTTSFSGVQTIKFVVKFTSDGSIQGLFAFYVNNVASASITPSIITTTPSYISSIQNAIGYDKIIWNQTLGAKAPGDIKITIQGSSDGVNFSNVTGFVDMLAPDGNGAKNIDISTIDHTIYPYLRAIFYLNNQNARLHDFGFSYKNKPLPVSLLSFTAKCEDDKINFAWSTASEMSPEYFEIIETKNFIHFNTLAKISAAGFSSQTINYEYQAKANYEKTYYQLKQYDFDGKNELLSTIVSDCKNNIDNEIYVYPNPNNGEEVIISTSSVMDEAFIFIYDAAGRLIREFKFLEFGGENVLKFKPKLEPGAYVIKIINSNNEYKYFKIIVN